MLRQQKVVSPATCHLPYEGTRRKVMFLMCEESYLYSSRMKEHTSPVWRVSVASGADMPYSSRMEEHFSFRINGYASLVCRHVSHEGSSSCSSRMKEHVNFRAMIPPYEEFFSSRMKDPCKVFDREEC